ncbi:unnamed protein product [Lymnaea stagnalis]|uniref:RING-type domain-containing protein n=1 Tax=Lymnaea stagnalis TaxID=6523 RepID=A0AAV2HQ29_LYMST
MANKNMLSKKKITESASLTLTAVALQDHWSRTLSLGPNYGPKKIGLGPAARAKQKNEVKAIVDTGRHRVKKSIPSVDMKEREYVLDEKPPPLTLAQKFGLVHAPKQLLSEQEWNTVKAKSNQRDDSQEPCVICKEDFGLQEQVILSCTHVFHRACLQAFERFTGKKTCPMCRHEQYQTRIIHEGARLHKHRSATKIQSLWRGYVVRCWYKQLRETVPPKDMKLRKKFYEEKLSAIVERMIKSIDVNITEFMREIDNSVQLSRAAFSLWDAAHQEISPEKWDAIQLKAVERGDVDCPICLTELQLGNGFATNAFNSTSPISENSCTTKSASSAKATTYSSSHLRRKSLDKKLLTKLSKVAIPNGVDYLGNDEGRPESVFPGNKPDEMGEGSSQLAITYPQQIRSTVLLSCTHVFHTTCLKTLEEIAMVDLKNICPVCRAHYQKKIIVY